MKAEDIKEVTVIGGGTMGQGIAQNFAQAGLLVWITDLDKERLNHSLAEMAADLRLFQEFGLLEEAPSTIEARIKPILPTDLLEAVQKCDFVVEAVPEDLELKRQLYTQLDASHERTILSSNTSSLTISAITKGLRTADRVIGVHYFYPAHIMPLVEIHYGLQTREDVIATTKEFMQRVGKKPIVVKKEISGFVVNRLQSAIVREILYLIDEGIASPEDIDMAAKASYGLRWACTGNIEAMDMVGLDTVLAASRNIFKTLSNSTEPTSVLVGKVQRGELGVKSGRGWFDYASKSRAEILEEQNRRLLKQLSLFKELDK